MPHSLQPQPLTPEAFAPFGQVLQKDGARNFAINDGTCRRFHDLANVEATGPGGRVIVSLVTGEPSTLPLLVEMVERHPFGSQAFHPLSRNRFLVVVCEDEDGRPVRPRAFLTSPGQGVNYDRNVWHGVLTPLGETSDFLIVDRDGEGDNLEVFTFDEPVLVRAPGE
ncbi:ureidoglycolate lyase [Microbaculum marinum]|uniref:Ureidoglycolate lyase n=1 Tax=Microbaculum marinum TaxID=1764581 RepID=A0AAW9S0E4_9HYPH